MRRMVVMVVVGATVLGAATTSAASAAVHPPLIAGQTNSTSSNWSGYAVTGGPFTGVSASWTQPAVTCAPGETSYASFWVGLDGDTSSTVEQIGTDSDCVNGVATYYAWDELYPKVPAQLTTISPGDKVSASVAADSNGGFTLTISVNGTPTTVQGTVRHAALASAEVIAEAPSSNHGPNGELGLGDFGTVSFTSATANGISLALQSPDPITMVQGGTTLAQPTPISNSGNFSIVWQAPSGTPTGHGHGHH